MIRTCIAAIDLGNINTVVAIANMTGVKVFQDMNEGRENKSYIELRDDRRAFGYEAYTHAVINAERTVHSLAALVHESVGPEANARLAAVTARLPFSIVPSTRSRYAAVKVPSASATGAEDGVVDVEFLLSSYVRRIFDAILSHNLPITDFTYAYPAFWPLSKRRALLACSLYHRDTLKPATFFTQHLCAAAAYHMKTMPILQSAKKDFYFNCFSIGEYSYFYAIFKLAHQGIETVAFTYNERIGSASFDKALADVFLRKAAALLPDETFSTARNKAKLTRALKEAKKTLSMATQAKVSLEGIGRDASDVSVTITLAEFVAEAKPLIDAIRSTISAMCYKELPAPGAVELIGSASRMVPIASIFADLYDERTITRRLNNETAIAEGLGWLSFLTHPGIPRKVEFDIKDRVYRAIYASVSRVATPAGKAGAAEAATVTPIEELTNLQALAPGDYFPSAKDVDIPFGAPEGSYRLVLHDLSGAVYSACAFTVQSRNIFRQKQSATLRVSLALDISGTPSVSSIALSDGWRDFTEVPVSDCTADAAATLARQDPYLDLTTNEGYIQALTDYENRCTLADQDAEKLTECINDIESCLIRIGERTELTPYLKGKVDAYLDLDLSKITLSMAVKLLQNVRALEETGTEMPPATAQ